MAQQGNDGGNNPVLPFGYNQEYIGAESSSEQPQAGYHGQTVLAPSDAAYIQQFFQNPDAASAGEDVYNLGGLSMANKPDNGGFGGGWDFNQQGSQAHQTHQTPAPQSHAAFQAPAQGSQHTPQPQHQGLGHPFGGGHEQMTHTASDADLLSGASSLFNMSAHQDQSQQPNFGGQWGNLGVGPMIAPPESLQSPLTSSGRQSSGGSLYTPTSGHTPSYSHQQLAQQIMHMQQMQHQSPHPSQPQQSHVPGQQQGQAHTRHPSLQLDTGNYPMFQHALPQQWQQMQLQQQQQSRTQGLPPRPALVRYGTDSSFLGPNAYRSPVAVPPEQEKAGNLMNVPLAGQVAAAQTPLVQQMQGFRPAHPQMYQRHSMQGPIPPRPNSAGPSPTSAGMAGLAMASPMSGASHRPTSSWGTMHMSGRSQDEDEDFGQVQPRKRRKSQLDRVASQDYSRSPQPRGNVPKRGPKVPKAEEAIDEEAEYEPQAAPRTPKRRKSTMTSRQSVESVPSDDTPSSTSMPPDSANQASASGSKKRAREAKPRQNLSEEQKRANHIQSEQKRRNIIKQGYEDLNILVPSLAGGKSGFSKSEILKEVVLYLEATLAGNVAIEQLLSQYDT